MTRDILMDAFGRRLPTRPVIAGSSICQPHHHFNGRVCTAHHPHENPNGQFCECGAGLKREGRHDDA